MQELIPLKGRRGGARRGAGRKPKTATEVVSIRLPKSQAHKYRQEAKRRGIALNKLLEGLLSKAVVIREDKRPPPAVIDVD